MAVGSEAPPPNRRLRIALGALLCGLTAAVYLPVVGHEWLNYDDDVYITANPQLLAGLSREGIAWAFTTVHGANWFPLTWLSWLLDFEIYGLDPHGFHTTSLMLHVANALLLFLALDRFTSRPYPSFFTAAVFAVHPLHVESVAWAAARKDPLSGLFFMLALFAYARSSDAKGGALRRFWVWLWLTLGLLAKPMLVTLPFVLLLLDDWPLGRLRRRDAPGRWDPARIRKAALAKWTLFATAAAFCAATLFAQGRGGMVASLELLPFAARAGNAVVAYASYLGKAFWPAGLAVFYPHSGGSPPAGQLALAGALLFGITLFALRSWSGRAYLAVGWFWFVGMLVPVIGLVQIGSQSMADRYTYLPLIGLAIAVGWGIPELLRGARRRVPLLTIAAVAVVVALTVSTTRQLRHWRDSASLFEHALAVTEDNAIAHAHLGIALLERGETAAAIDHYRSALALQPSFLQVANNLAWLLGTSADPAVRDPELAVRWAEHADRLAGSKRAAVLDTLAAAYAARGRFGEAVRTSRQAITLARGDGDEALVRELEERLTLYSSGRAYTEPFSP